MYKFYFLFAINIFSVCLYGQSLENNIWYFGNNAGLDFSTNPPTSITGALSTYEGCTVISDPAGNLLFYSDGLNVWDRTHTLMPNGTGLLGGNSSTQSGLIVPLPGSCNLYYLFTVEDHFGNATFRYSIIDICLNGGYGDVVVGSKNILITSPVGERLSSALHSNGTDIWIVTHEMGSNDFLAYQLSAAGLSATPVVSSVGSNHPTTAVIGPLKMNSSGDQLVVELTFGNTCELFDFDNSTGVVSNPVSLTTTYSIPNGAYGAEFSPSGDILYVSTCWVTSRLYQIDLVAGVSTQLASTTGNYKFGALQLGLDGRIYMARNPQPYLDVIEYPDISGVGCSYVNSGQTLATATNSEMGLPNFAPYSNYTVQQISPALGVDTILCAGDSIVYDFSFNACVTSLSWENGSTNPYRVIAQPGTYILNVTGCLSYSDTIEIDSVPLPQQFLISDTVVCDTQLILNVPPNVFDSLFWSTGDTTDTIVVNSSGSYTVIGFNACGFSADTVQVLLVDSIYFSLGPDVTICDGDTLILSNPLSTSGIWSTGSTGNSIVITQAGTYWLEISTPCDTVRDSIIVTVDFPLIPDLGPDTTLCIGDSVFYDLSGLNASSYLWNTGLTSPFNTVAAGLHWINVTNSCGLFSDSVEILQIPALSVDLGNDITICSGDSAVLSAVSGISGTWSNGSVGSTITVSQAGTYSLTVSNQCDTIMDSIVVFVDFPLNPDLGPDTSFCPNTLNVFNASSLDADTYLWSTGVAFYVNTLTWGLNWLQVSNTCGVYADSVVLSVIPPLVVDLGPDTTMCGYDSLILQSNPIISGNWSNGTAGTSMYATQPGTYWLQAYNQCESASDTIVIDTLIQPSFSVNDQIICAYDLANFTLSGINGNDSVLWFDGSSSNSITTGVPGVYWVDVFNACYVVTDSFQLDTFNVSEPITNLADLSICSDSSIWLYANAGNSDQVLWNTGSTSDSLLASGNNTYTLEVSNVCYSVFDTATISNIYPPNISFGDVVLCEEEVYDLIVAPGTGSVVWNDSVNSETLSVSEPGVYWVNVTNSCGFDEDSIVVTQEYCNCELFIPNAFTPNDDGLNDLFGVKTICEFEYFKFQIYDRWGALMFETSDPLILWNGRFNGHPVKHDVYVWKVEYEYQSLNSASRTLKRGHVVVVR